MFKAGPIEPVGILEFRSTKTSKTVIKLNIIKKKKKGSQTQLSQMMGMVSPYHNGSLVWIVYPDTA